MDYANLLLNQSGKILTITLNRPSQLNALNTHVFAELESAVKAAEKDKTVGGIIITGSGEKAFAAGADIKEFANFSPEQARELALNGQRIFKIIETLRKPVIAAVNGFALGGGCELCMACHLRIASENARFGQPEVTLGVTPGYAGTQRMTQLIGKGKAAELLMTGDMIKADEALRLGLVNYVVSLPDLPAKATELLNKILDKSPVAVSGVINCINAYYTEGVDGFAAEAEEFCKCFGTDDFKEGTSAFIEKRKADFPGFTK
jgi:enoyl-CoA hydratase